MLKKIFAFLNLANNSLQENNKYNIEVKPEVIPEQESIFKENLGVKLFSRLQNFTSKEKFDIPKKFSKIQTKKIMTSLNLGCFTTT